MAARAEDETARNFRIFAERTGNDPLALAAIQKTPRRLSYDPSALGRVTLPALVLLGEGDTLVGHGDRLAAGIPGAKLVMVPGDHLTAVGPALARAAVEFLAEVSPAAAS